MDDRVKLVPLPAAPCSICGSTGGTIGKGMLRPLRYDGRRFGVIGKLCRAHYDKFRAMPQHAGPKLPRRAARPATEAERAAVLGACRALIAAGEYPTEMKVRDRVCTGGGPGRQCVIGYETATALRRELLASGLVDLSGVAVPRRDTAEPSAEERAGVAARTAEIREAKHEAERTALAASLTMGLRPARVTGRRPVQVARAGNLSMGHLWRDW